MKMVKPRVATSPSVNWLWIVTALGLERTAAAAGLHGVRILKGESLFLETFVPVDGRSIKIQSTFLIDDDGNAVAVIFRVGLFVERVVESSRRS